MALARNTGSTLGGICVNLILYDPSVSAIVDLGSAPATIVKHANTTLGTGTWDGVARPYFQTPAALTQGVTFSAGAPVLKHGSGETGNGQFIAIAKGSGTGSDRQMVITPSANFVMGLSYDGGSTGGWCGTGANGTVLIESSQQSAATDYSANFAVVWNSKYNTATNGRQIFVDADNGTATAWDSEETEPGDGSTAATIVSIGYSAASGAYLSSRIFVYANFSRLITLAEAQQLRDDWYTQLISAGGAGPTSILPLVSRGLSGMGDTGVIR